MEETGDVGTERWRGMEGYKDTRRGDGCTDSGWKREMRGGGNRGVPGRDKLNRGEAKENMKKTGERGKEPNSPLHQGLVYMRKLNWFNLKINF